MHSPELNRSPDSRVDVEKLHLGRLARLRDELRSRDCAAGLFYDPMNIRYATGTSNMQVYSLHNPCRYAFVATEGPVVMFDFKGCAHLSEGCPAVDEVRDAISWYHFVTGQHGQRKVEQWAASLAELLAEVGGGNRRIAVDRLDPPGMAALARRQITVVDGQEPASMARMIKTAPELLAIQEAVDVCEAGIRAMDEARRPRITEQALWSILHQINIERGGEWIETRLLSSGPRTNPWYQEAGARRIEDGDIVSFDTDLVGPHGYSADISRSWLVGDRRATDAQRRQYALAHEQVSRNVELFKAGVSYREIAERAFSLPEPMTSIKSERSPMASAFATSIRCCCIAPATRRRETRASCTRTWSFASSPTSVRRGAARASSSSSRCWSPPTGRSSCRAIPSRKRSCRAGADRVHEIGPARGDAQHG